MERSTSTRRIPWVLAVVFLLPGTPARATPSPASAFDPQFAERERPEAARAALMGYRTAWKANPEDAEAAWRVAMACYFVGLRLTESAETRRQLFDEGFRAGRRAVEIAPDCAPCRFWTAINLALYGENVGVLKTLSSVREIRAHLEASIAADPAYAYGGAHRLLAIIDQKLPGILGGDDDRALRHFRQAIAAAPDEPLNYLFMIRFLRETGRPEALAREALRDARALPRPAADRLESREAWSQIQSLSSPAELAE